MKKSKFSLAFLLLIISLSFFFTLSNFSSAQTLNVSSGEINYGNSLLRIFSETKVGYIDTSGNLVIPPKYANAGDFSEGLAPARINSKFGFINTKGDFVIEPGYDYAEEFRNGAAVVYKDSTAGLLHSDGTEIFFPNYRSIKFISNNNAIVTTHSGSKGFINISGELLLDTIYADMTDINNGIALLYKYVIREDGAKNKKYETAVIDTNLNFVVPFEKYQYVREPRNGFIRVTEYPEYSTINYDCILDAAGKILLRKSTDEMNGRDTYYTPVSDSIFMVQYFRMDSANNQADYFGILNTKTDSVIKNENWSWVQILSPDFFLVRQKDGGKNLVLNSRGEQLIDTTLYDYINFSGEPYNYITLRKNDLNALYNFSGKELVPYQEKYIGVMQNDFTGKPFKKLFFYTNDYDTVINEHRGRILDSNMNVKFIFPRDNMRIISSKNGFMSTYDSNYFYCLNADAELIYRSNLWSGKSSVNIDFMKQMNYSTNFLDGRKIISTKNIERNKSKILLYINKNESVLYNKRFAGLPLYIINKRDEDVSLGPSDFLDVLLQAKDANGKWRYIEGQFLFFFDHSQTDFILRENKFHRTAIPLFDGDFKTKLRAELIIRNPDYKNSRLSVFSNEIDCRINPSQFRRKLDDFKYDYANPYLRLINR